MFKQEEDTKESADTASRALIVPSLVFLPQSLAEDQWSIVNPALYTKKMYKLLFVHACLFTKDLRVVLLVIKIQKVSTSENLLKI